MPIPALARRVDSVAATPLYYERTASGDPWGDLPESEKYGVYMMPSFSAKLDDCFVALEETAGSGLKGIITAGGWVDKPGAHGIARAFDLDGLIFADGRSFKASSYNTIFEKKIYYGVVCHCMLHFGNVLGWEYNVAHRDHLHLDDLIHPLFRTNSRAVVTSIQAALKYVWPLHVIEAVGASWIDGDFGPATASAFKKIIPFSGRWPTQSQYEEFLRRTASAALRTDKAQPTFPVKMIPNQVIASTTWIASVENRLKALEEK